MNLVFATKPLDAIKLFSGGIDVPKEVCVFSSHNSVRRPTLGKFLQSKIVGLFFFGKNLKQAFPSAESRTSWTRACGRTQPKGEKQKGKPILIFYVFPRVIDWYFSRARKTAFGSELAYRRTRWVGSGVSCGIWNKGRLRYRPLRVTQIRCIVAGEFITINKRKTLGETHDIQAWYSRKMF